MAVRRREGPDFRLENSVSGTVCGVDEAGRGPWAGPVIAAAVILDPDRTPEGLDDSKKLPADRREVLERAIKTRAVAWAVGFASVEEIESLNILQATALAMRRAVTQLSPTPAVALVDGSFRFDLPCEVRPVVGGDGISASIAAASILAKTARDRLMRDLDNFYPGYGFAAHKGYGVPVHARALETLGPCPAHRRSFAPVRRVLERLEGRGRED